MTEWPIGDHPFAKPPFVDPPESHERRIAGWVPPSPGCEAPPGPKRKSILVGALLVRNSLYFRSLTKSCVACLLRKPLSFRNITVSQLCRKVAWIGGKYIYPQSKQLLHVAAKCFALLDLCVSSLRRGHANLLCIVPILTHDLRRESNPSHFCIRPISLLTLSLLTLLDSNFLVNPLWAWESHPLILRLCLSQTL